MNKFIVYKKIVTNLTQLSISFISSILLVFGYVTVQAYSNNEITQQDTKEIEFASEYSSPNPNLETENNTSLRSTIEVETYDFRVVLFDNYFKENNSPLYGHGIDFVEACDKYNTPYDCTLLPAIAKVETNLCKTDISSSQFNCWGYGGSGENRIHYTSFPEAIDDITGRLMNGYRAAFFEDPEIGELFYCGSHCDTWGDKVKEVQNTLKARANAMGYEL